MSDLQDLLEETLEDMYSTGKMTDEEYAEAAESITDPDHLNDLSKNVSSRNKRMWREAIDDFHNKQITEQEYADILDLIMVDIETSVVDGILDSYDRAMKGI